jgi:hypothetical protein
MVKSAACECAERKNALENIEFEVVSLARTRLLICQNSEVIKSIKRMRGMKISALGEDAY